MHNGVKLAAAAILLVGANISTANAGALEDGYAATQKGDFETAFKLWRPLADDGNVAAQFNLGYLYDKGQGVRQNFVEAVRWFRQAAEQNDAISQYTLGNFYELGKGVQPDKVQAHMWYTLAAARFPQTEQKASHDRAVAARERVAAQMTKAELDEAQRLAFSWKR